MRPLRFISEQIEAVHGEHHGPEKRLGCPDSFVWRGEEHHVAELLKEWHDYTRRGKFQHNMRPWHAEAAASRGSWGVGRDYYLVRTDRGRLFELYYDRAPKGSKERAGRWVLFRELAEAE